MANTQFDLPLLYGLVGRIVVHWGYVEMGLDQCIVVICRQRPETDRCNDPPLSMVVKLKFMRNAFKSIPEFAPVVDDGRKMLTRISATSEKRNEIIHSAILAVTEAGELRFSGFRVENKKHVPKYTTKTAAGLDVLGQEITTLAEDTALFARRLVGCLAQRKGG